MQGADSLAGSARTTVTLPVWGAVRFNLLSLGAVTLITVITLIVAAGMWGWTYDDAYIIYRYARNFADGQGMVYNPGQHYLGTSSAAYTLVLALLYKLLPGLDFLILGSIVSFVSLMACGMLVWSMGALGQRPLTGLLAALTVVANPLMLHSWGGEMPMLVAFVLAAIACYWRGFDLPAGLFLGLAVLTRQDSLVLVALVGAHSLLLRRRLPWRLMATFAPVLAPWVLYTSFFFGSPLPGTLEAKIAQGKAGWPFFLSGSIEWLSGTIGEGVPRWLVVALALFGAAALLVATLNALRQAGRQLWSRRERTTGPALSLLADRDSWLLPWLLLLGWALLFTAGYTVLRVSFYGWYAVPMSVGIGVLAAWGAVTVARLVTSLVGRLGRQAGSEGTQRKSLVAPLLSGLALALLILPVAARVYDHDRNFVVSKRESDLYERAGKWLAARNSPSSSVAYLEVGEIGYYSRMNLVDLLGLVTPDAAAQVPSHNFEWTVQRYKPQYYLANARFDALLGHIEQQAWFTSAYRPVASFDDVRRGRTQPGQMVVYERVPGADLPAPSEVVAIQRTNQQAGWIVPGEGDAPLAAESEGQTFFMPQANLSAVSLLIGQPVTQTTGTLVLHLRSSPDDTTDLRRVEAPLSEIVNNTWYNFRFDPVPDSRGRTYFFYLEIEGLPPGPPPLALWYATDDLYPGGTRYDGLEPAPGDLSFRVHVPSAVSSP